MILPLESPFPSAGGEMCSMARLLLRTSLRGRLQHFRPESQHGEFDEVFGELKAILRRFGYGQCLLPKRS